MNQYSVKLHVYVELILNPSSNIDKAIYTKFTQQDKHVKCAITFI